MIASGWPLRILVPVALLLVAAGSAMGLHWMEIRRHQSGVIGRAELEALEVLSRIDKRLSRPLVEGDLERVAEILADAKAQPLLLGVALCDEAAQVLLGSEPGWSKQAAEEVLPTAAEGPPSELASYPAAWISWDRLVVGAVRGVPLLGRGPGPVSRREGFLLIEYDLRQPLAEVEQAAQAGLPVNILVLAIPAALLGLLIDRKVFARIDRIRTSADELRCARLEQGTKISGRDTLDLLEESIGALARQAEEAQEGRRRSEQTREQGRGR